MRVSPDRWGKDHWSTFAYIEGRCVDHRGIPQPMNIQTNQNRHPGMGNNLNGEDYSIRLANGEELPGDQYDEWDCLDDMEAYGLLENVGTGINRRYRLTDTGKRIAGQLRGHKADGKNFASFQPAWDEVPALRVKIHEHLSQMGVLS